MKAIVMLLSCAAVTMASHIATAHTVTGQTEFSGEIGSKGWAANRFTFGVGDHKIAATREAPPDSNVLDSGSDAIICAVFAANGDVVAQELNEAYPARYCVLSFHVYERQSYTVKIGLDGRRKIVLPVKYYGKLD